jgi:hypothetical protein
MRIFLKIRKYVLESINIYADLHKVLIDGCELNCQNKFYKIMSTIWELNTWLLTPGGIVCCRQRRGWICFCTVPIDGSKLSPQDEFVKMEQSR